MKRATTCTDLLVTGELLERTREVRALCRSDSKRESTARRTGVGCRNCGKIRGDSSDRAPDRATHGFQ